MSAVVDRIAEVLRDHPRYEDGLGPLNACVCGQIGDHVAHVAERIAAALNLTDAEAIAGDIEFCMEAGHPDTARKQLGRLISLLSGWTTAEDHR